jgi:hypothetical protein
MPPWGVKKVTRSALLSGEKREWKINGGNRELGIAHRTIF